MEIDRAVLYLVTPFVGAVQGYLVGKIPRGVISQEVYGEKARRFHNNEQVDTSDLAASLKEERDKLNKLRKIEHALYVGMLAIATCAAFNENISLSIFLVSAIAGNLYSRKNYPG